ncbi:acyl-coenzyme A thioesterase 9, mitochondrial-like [Chenopodium quinoa]|uniref:acyl-coenzyme A thioesterase 9, mitochondrial-like n=1 Tax=Chenopodium quinoa TaxID=63459 RepID=UPI000B76D0C3|nr:acyl-coenzyme A thioesterase 9, mitochondrial-like [Chenopodium quinoa]
MEHPNYTPSNFISVYSNLPKPFEDSSTQEFTDGKQKPLSLWPGMYHSPVTIALWETRSKIFEIMNDPSVDHPPQTHLLTRTPAQSRMTVLYNFSSDFILREQYRDPWNEMRIGKLLEDLDALAGTISVKHCSDDDYTTRPLLLVTASVDRIVLKKPISVDSDLRISGSVIWVGWSSIEIQLDVSQAVEGSFASDSVALTANFIFVARDSKTRKAAPVNRLSPETDKEKILFEEAEERSKYRKRKGGLNKKDYANGEVDRLATLLSEGRIFCDMPALADRNSILLRDTRLANSLICQPQQRNIHGRIFGGFLMHRAFELAFSTAYAFAGVRPSFLEVDHVDFLKPVDVGDFLRFKSCVLYTELEDPEHPLINVEVEAHVTRPEIRSSEVSNTFYFTFTICPEAKAEKNKVSIRNVVAATEEEARHIIERKDAKALQVSKCSNKDLTSIIEE